MATHPETFEYGVATAMIAGATLQEQVNQLATSARPNVFVEIKTDLLGVHSPVTPYDRATEQLISSLYKGTNVRVKGEEGVGNWPKHRIPTLDLHVDPIDGTELFVEYVKKLIAWTRLPVDRRPPRPQCGSMVSVGAVRPGRDKPDWGTVAAPFMFEHGVVLWTGGANEAATRTEPNGSRYELPQAHTLPAPRTGGVVLVASDSAERVFGDSLKAAGYKVVKYKSAVAAALCVMDPSLFERLCPGELSSEPIVGVVMRTAKNWDVAAVIAIANKLGHFVSNTHGRPRTFEDGANSAILATRESVGRALVRAVAPQLHQG